MIENELEKENAQLQKDYENEKERSGKLENKLEQTRVTTTTF